MSLFTATCIVAALLAIPALSLLIAPVAFSNRLKLALRSGKWTAFIFGSALIWFLYHILHLGEADFGEYKIWLFILFGGAGLICVFSSLDFLSVRGAAGLALFSANVFLEAAYRQPQISRLWLVGFIYVVIAAALYFAALPFRMRDLMDWFIKRPLAARFIALLFTAYSLLLFHTALHYK